MEKAGFSNWSGNNGRGGEHQFVTPSFILSLLAVGLTGALTWHAFALRDILISYVPRDAGIYIHENREAGSTLLPLPAQASPDEAALFATLDENLEPLWGWLLAWHSAADLTEAEISAIQEAGGRAVDRGVWLIGGEAAGAAVERTRHGDPTLNDDRDIRQATALLRSTMSLQGFVNFNLVPPSVLADVLAPFHELEPTVFGVERRGGVMRLAAMSLAKATAKSAALGFGAPNAEGSARGRTIPQSSVTISSSELALDPIQTIFAPVEETRILGDYPESIAYADAVSNLRQLLESPSDIALFRNEGRPVLAAILPATDSTELKSAVETYINIALPVPVRKKLPDNDTIIEYRMPEPALAFTPAALIPDSYRSLWELRDENRDIVVLIATNLRGQTVLTTDPVALEFLAKPSSKTAAPRTACLNSSFRKHLTISDPELLSSLELISAAFVETVDNIVLGCGLSK